MNKDKGKTIKTVPDSNSNLAKSITHHNQTKKLTTWFLTRWPRRTAGTLRASHRPAPKPPTGGTPRPPSAKKGMHITSGSNQPATNLQEDDKNKDKEVLADPSDSDKKLRVGGNLDAN
jgi:hypothetical protein